MLSNGRILRSSCILLVFAVASSVVARANDPPVAVINFPQSQDEFVIDEIVPFSSTGSNDPDGTIAEYEWTFGDTDQSSEQYPTHSYISPNDYVVQLRVKDNQGQWSPPVQTTIHVIGDGVPIPPQWVFEPWVWQDDHGEQSEQGTRDLVSDYLSRDIPTAGVIIDSPWEHAYNDFSFRGDWFDDPQDMINDLHAQGVKVIMWMTGYLNVSSNDAEDNGKVGTYDYAAANGYFVESGKTYNWWKGTGSHIDFLNPDAIVWWRTQMDLVLDMNIDGWKVDMSPNTVSDDPVQTWQGEVPRSRLMHQYYREFYRYTKKRRAKGMITCRPVDISPQATIDATPAGWVGDEVHDWSNAGLGEALSDIFESGYLGYLAFGSDIGGYFGGGVAPKNLFIRWAQFGAFCPVMEVGGVGDHRPWSYDAETLDIYRYFAKLHSQLTPYQYTHALEAQTTQLSLFRPQGEPVQWPGDWRYKFGPDIFCAAIYHDTLSRDVELPQGDTWIDYWDETIGYPGGMTLGDYAVPLERYPIFLRKGSIIPMNVRDGETGHGTTSSAGHLTVLIHPQQSNSISIHREDLADVSISVAPQADGYEVVVGPGDVPIVLRVRAGTTVEGVKLGGSPLDQGGTLDATIASSTAKWYYEAPPMRAWVKLPASGSSRTVLLLMATDANEAPYVDAGADQAIDFVEVAHLTGTAIDDGLPDPPGSLEVTWSKFSGPGNVQFADNQAAQTTAVFDAPGQYVLQLEADDNQRQRTDTVTVTVEQNASLLAKPAPTSPLVNDSVTFTAVPLSVPGGLSVSYYWVISDPNETVVHTADTQVTSCQVTLAGEYSAQLTATFTESQNELTDTAGVYAYPFPGRPDFDFDHDVDQEDFGHLQVCLSGQDIEQTDPQCAGAMLDGDNDVDLTDVGIFLSCLSGAKEAADPQCLRPLKTRAANPSPADLATEVDWDADLTWTPAAGADSHNVYFGSTYPVPSQGNQTEATFDPGTLARGTTCLWRIDEVFDAHVHTGDVWVFTTIPDVTITNLNRYEPANLSVGSEYFTDRAYTITSMPAYLEGEQGIKTANADKNETSETWITFDIDRGAHVYIAYDRRAAAVPNWMSDYADTGDTIGVSDTHQGEAQVYKKTFPAGGVVLGGNKAPGSSGADSNYFVLVVPAGGD